jgi:hypothetical protein
VVLSTGPQGITPIRPGGIVDDFEITSWSQIDHIF